MHHTLRHRGLPAVLAGFCAFIPTAHSATADIESTDDYLAISVEAEDFEDSAIDSENDDDRWILTDASTPQTLEDPDDNNSSGAAGETYLELLPDIRVTHDDPFSPPTAFWGNPGSGPTLAYEVDFPEAGRYYLHVRLNSSGTEDNGIHAGLNEDWPDSAERVQSCSAGQGWVWTSRQRGSGDVPHCGLNFTLWLDVAEAGINTVKFSAREDGFEFDRFVLIKDKSDNTRICKPANELQITCVNGSLESADDLTEIAVNMDVDRTTGVVGDLFVFNASISNDDAFDTAQQVIMESTLDLTDTWQFVSASDSCTVSGQLLQCTAGDIEPTAADEDLHIEFTLRAITEGDQTVNVDVTTTSEEENSANNSSSVEIKVVPMINYAAIASTIGRDILDPTVADTVRLTVSLENFSDIDSENTSITFNPPSGLQFSDVDSSCTQDTSDQLVCNIGSLNAQSSQAISVGLQTETSGFYAVTVVTAADNLADGSFSSTYMFEVVEVAEVEEQTEVDEHVEVTTTDGNVDLPGITDNEDVDNTSEEEKVEEENEKDVTVASNEEAGVVTQTSSGGAAGCLLLTLLSLIAVTKISSLSRSHLDDSVTPAAGFDQSAA